MACSSQRGTNLLSVSLRNRTIQPNISDLPISWLFAPFVNSDPGTSAKEAILKPQWSGGTIYLYTNTITGLSGIEASQGVFDFTDTDARFAAHLALTPYGKQICMIFAWGPFTGDPPQAAPWFPSYSQTNAVILAVSNAVAHIAQHYVGKIVALHPVNEPIDDYPTLLYNIQVLQACKAAANPYGIAIIGPDRSSPAPGGLAWMARNGLLAAVDWIGCHIYFNSAQSGAGQAPDVYDPNYGRLDQTLVMITNWGKPIVFHEFGLECRTNQYLLDRSLKEFVMLRAYGVRSISPDYWVNGSTNCLQDGCAWVNEQMVPASSNLLHFVALVGESGGKTLSVQYPFYFYQFSNNVAFTWIAEVTNAAGTVINSPTGMIASGWTSGPTYIDGTPAPTNTLSSTPVVFTGTGTITLMPTDAVSWWNSPMLVGSWIGTAEVGRVASLKPQWSTLSLPLKTDDTVNVDGLASSGCP